MFRMRTRSFSPNLSDLIVVKHDTVKSAFIAVQGTNEVGRLEYRFLTRKDAGTVDFYHTITVPEARGKGIAAEMVRKGLEWARSNKYSVIPSCSYVSAFMDRSHSDSVKVNQ